MLGQSLVIGIISIIIMAIIIITIAIPPQLASSSPSSFHRTYLPTHSHRITFRNVIAFTSACLSDAKPSKSATNSSLPPPNVTPPSASAYILLIRCLYLPPPPLQQHADAPPPSLLRAVAMLVIEKLNFNLMC
jgi:hypothetical protein